MDSVIVFHPWLIHIDCIVCMLQSCLHGTRGVGCIGSFDFSILELDPADLEGMEGEG